MGMSLSASIEYGIAIELDGSEFDFEVDEEEIDAFLLDKFAPGLRDQDPWNNFPREIEDLPWESRRNASIKWIEEHREAIDSHREQRKEVLEKVKCGCEVGYYGPDGYMSHTIHISESSFGCGWEASQLDTDDFKVGDDWNVRLKQFFENMEWDIDFDKYVGWQLTARYW